MCEDRFALGALDCRQCFLHVIREVSHSGGKTAPAGDDVGMAQERESARDTASHAEAPASTHDTTHTSAGHSTIPSSGHGPSASDRAYGGHKPEIAATEEAMGAEMGKRTKEANGEGGQYALVRASRERHEQPRRERQQ